MAFLGSLFLILAIVCAVLFSGLVLLTGKGDAMSGGGSVRTTYKGKATFDDIMSRATLFTGIAFMALVLGYQIVMKPSSRARGSAPQPASSVDLNLPAKDSGSPAAADTNAAANAPANNAPANNAPAAETNQPK